MDGVIADFVSGVSAAHGRPSPYENGGGRGIFDIEKLWGISAVEFWKPTNSVEFWLNLPKMPDADYIVAFLADHFGEDNVAILTAPSLFDGCMAAKRKWIEQHYPQFAKRVIFSPAGAKSFLASEHNVLIDDRDENVERFQLAGGAAVLVPRPWNKDHRYADMALGYVKHRVFWPKGGK
jgi:5'(3')-deoxyribonucleotidase